MILVIPVAADHNVTFVNTCDQDIWINLQGGPKGTGDGVIDNSTHTLQKGSACSLCPANANTSSQQLLCNTSIATGTSEPLCCPGVIQEKLYCWSGTACSITDPVPQCCDETGLSQTAGTWYNCPGANQITGCQNSTMIQAQIDALSGYNNPANHLSPLVCNESPISGGGFSSMRTPEHKYSPSTPGDRVHFIQGPAAPSM